MISKVSEFVLKILGLGILSLCDGSNTSCELVSTMKTNLQGWQGNLISWPFLGVGIGWIGDSFEMFLFSQRHSISSDLPCSDLWLFVGVIFHLDDARWHRPWKLCKCNSTPCVASVLTHLVTNMPWQTQITSLTFLILMEPRKLCERTHCL